MRNYPKAGSKELIIMTTVFNITTALIKSYPFSLQ